MSTDATTDNISWLILEFRPQDSVSKTDLDCLSQMLHQDQWYFAERTPFQSKRNLELFPTSRQRCAIMGP